MRNFRPALTVRKKACFTRFLPPFSFQPEFALMVGVAQLVRAPDCGSGGRRFNSGRPPFAKRLIEPANERPPDPHSELPFGGFPRC